MAKPDFLDDVVSGMGPPDKKYGADMSAEDDGDGMDDESDPEEAQQDRVMAAKSILKAMNTGDASKLAEALKAFVSSC